MLKVDINLVFTIINLLVLFVAMRIFFFKPIKKIIDDRQAEADRQFEEAKNKQTQAEELKTQYEASLASAENEKKQILAKARKEKLPIVDKDFNLKGLITIKDIEKQIKYPLAAKDEQGRLLCGAAVGITANVLARV